MLYTVKYSYETESAEEGLGFETRYGSVKVEALNICNALGAAHDYLQKEFNGADIIAVNPTARPFVLESRINFSLSRW